MSLWDDEDYTPADVAKERRQKARDDFFAGEDTTDKSEDSWFEYRRQAWYGMDDPDRHMIPFVTYMPMLLERTEPPSIISKSRFGFGSKEKKKEGAAADTALSPAELAAAAEDEYDEEGAAFTFFSKRKARHKELRYDATPRRGFDEESGATYIQKLYRARLAKKRLRTLLTQSWCKKHDSTPGIHYYQNVHTGETRWTPPVLYQRLFPGVHW